MLETACCSLQLPWVCRLQQQTGCDIVTGTRYKAQGGVCGWNFKRKLVSRGANFLAQTLLNPGVRSRLSIFASPLVSFQGCRMRVKPCEGRYKLIPACLLMLLRPPPWPMLERTFKACRCHCYDEASGNHGLVG